MGVWVLVHLEKLLSEGFARYAKVVVKWTPIFLGFPLLITLIAANVMYFKFFPIPLMRDTIYLYTPQHGQAAADRENLKANFPIPDTDLNFAIRRFDLEWMGFVIVTRKDNGSVVDPNIIFDVIQIWSNLNDVMIYDYGDNFVYVDKCVSLPMELPDPYCLQNPLFLLIHKKPELLPNITYPWYVIPSLDQNDKDYDSRTIFLGNLLGGVKTDNRSRITHADAILMPYQLRRDNPAQHDVDIAQKWEVKLTSYLEGIDHPKLEVSWWTYETMVTETRKEMKMVIILMNPLFLIITIFTVVTSMSFDLVRAKPWAAFGGCFSACCAIWSAISFILLWGEEFPSVAYFMPFIVFSIGVDDIYVLLMAWRRTPTKATVERRMTETLKEAGVSITVTSLTDILSFGIGCISDFPAVKYFCMYASIATVFVYCFQMTFFLAIMVYSGRRESKGRNALNCKVRKDAVLDREYPEPEEVIQQSVEDSAVVPAFFKGPYSTMLLKPVVKFAILAAYAAVLTGAIVGLARFIRVGLNPIDILPEQSYARRTIIYQNKYFTEYQDYLHVWFDDLSQFPFDEHLLENIEHELRAFENTTYTEAAEKNWIRDYRRFLNKSTPERLDEYLYETIVPEYNGTGIAKNVTRRERPLPEIVGRFFGNPSVFGSYPEYQHDIQFDPKDFYRLKATRFLVRLRNFTYPTHADAMRLLQGLAEKSKLNCRVFHDFFLFATQIEKIIPSLLINLYISVGVVVAVTLLLIPDPTASVWVCINIASILTCMIGYGSMWGVRLDFASMITIVMSIGFCVDFSAHVAYHFSIDKNRDVEGRLRGTMNAMAMPIVQSATSTILGVAVLAAIKNYVGYSFIKMIVLAAFFGAMHGLVVLPVVLTIFGDVMVWCSKRCSRAKTAPDTDVELYDHSWSKIAQKPNAD